MWMAALISPAAVSSTSSPRARRASRGGSLRGISKRRVLAVIRHFFFVPQGPASVLDPVKGDAIARDGSEATNRTNVAYHYDVSNDFYELFLDPEMVYTCAYFADDHMDLARAQADKLDMICRKLRLQPGERFLDIGSGWGGAGLPRRQTLRRRGARGDAELGAAGPGPREGADAPASPIA